MNNSPTPKICGILLFLCVFFSCTKKNSEANQPVTAQYTDVVIPDSSDYLIAIYKDSITELGSETAFINSKHDTIIPFGKYSHCWTDTLKSFAIVYDKINTNGETVAIDRNEHVLFDIYFFDNWPDEAQSGLFRVKRNEKIGFANSQGKIVIPCQFTCAFQFENGRAKVTYNCTEEVSDSDPEHTSPISDEWFYINIQGKRIK